MATKIPKKKPDYSVFIRLIEMRGMPHPDLELEFAKDIKRKWRFDLAWTEQMVALEIEGGLWNYGRHNRPVGMIKDMEKYNEAASRGWLVLRFPVEKLMSQETMDTIKRTLELRSKL